MSRLKQMIQSVDFKKIGSIKKMNLNQTSQPGATDNQHQGSTIDAETGDGDTVEKGSPRPEDRNANDMQ